MVLADDVVVGGLCGSPSGSEYRRPDFVSDDLFSSPMMSRPSSTPPGKCRRWAWPKLAHLVLAATAKATRTSRVLHPAAANLAHFRKIAASETPPCSSIFEKQRRPFRTIRHIRILIDKVEEGLASHVYRTRNTRGCLQALAHLDGLLDESDRKKKKKKQKKKKKKTPPPTPPPPRALIPALCCVGNRKVGQALCTKH